MKNIVIQIDAASGFGDMFDLEDALSLLFHKNSLLETSDGRVVDLTCYNVQVNTVDIDEDEPENSGLKDDPSKTNKKDSNG